MAIQIALTAEELGKIVSAGIPSIGTRKAIYQLTVYFAKETVAFCMFFRHNLRAVRRGKALTRGAYLKLPKGHNLRAVRRGKDVLYLLIPTRNSRHNLRAVR